MATLSTKGFTTLVRDFAAGVQSASTALIDFTIGSILRAVAEAHSAALLWLQGLVLQVLKVTRAATSTGTDLDTWVADFGMSRIGATSSTGLVTFARSSLTVVATIPVGALVSTTDNSQDFAVYADAANTYYSASLGAYVLAAGAASANLPVQAVNIGAQGNVVAGAISVLKTGISGVDTVSNPAGFTNGQDAEGDAALRSRFVAFINQLAKGTNAAITYAAQSAQQGIQVQIFNSKDPSGATNYGYVTVYVDDGSGAIPSSLLSIVSKRINAVRSAGDRVGIFAASTLTANIVIVLGYKAGYYAPTVIAQVTAAVTAYVNGLGLADTPADGTLDYRRLDQVCYDASAGVAKVASITVNGGGVSLVPGNGQTIKIGSLVIS